MTSDAVVQQVGDRPWTAWWRTLRIVLVAGWVLWAGLTWWTTPRETDVAQARADLAAGHVTSYEWGDSWQSRTGLLGPLGAELESSDGDGPIFLWHTDDGRSHYTFVPAAEGTAAQGTADEGTSFRAALQAFDDRGPAAELPFSTVLAGLGIAGALLALGTLISGPAPVTGTRWYWFWLISWLPFGLGLLWWLARERPWSPGAEPREKPWRWYAGIGFAILGGLALSLLVAGLHAVLGDAWIPLPG